MLRTLCLVLSLGALLGLATSSLAEEKEQTLKGTICCAKCELKKADKCHTVIKVTKDGKDIVFWFDADSSKKYHKEICTDAKEGSVVGTAKKDGDKMIVKVSKVEFK